MSDHRRRTVLVVDDDAEIRSVIVEFLQGHGFDLVEAANGLDALLQVKRAKPDVMVLDLMMPRLGGLDALTRIRPFAPRLRVVAMTGADDPELRERARSEGVLAVLTKPLDLSELLAALGEPAPGAPTPGTRGASGTPRGGRILIVDDDVEVAAVLEEFLRGHGHHPAVVHDAPSAFWAVTRERPEVILLDIALPGLSGVEIIPALQFASREVKIIMTSGTTDVELARRAMAFGAFDYLTKPVDLAELRESVDTALVMIRLESPHPERRLRETPEQRGGVPAAAEWRFSARVLVVDDDPTVVEILQEILLLDRHRVDTAADGAAALALVGDASYDAILCDLRMPAMDGVAVYRAIQRRRPEAAERVAFISADSSPEGRAAAEATGRPIVDKPFTISAIRTVIERLGRTGSA